MTHGRSAVPRRADGVKVAYTTMHTGCEAFAALNCELGLQERALIARRREAARE